MLPPRPGKGVVRAAASGGPAAREAAGVVEMGVGDVARRTIRARTTECQHRINNVPEAGTGVRARASGGRRKARRLVDSRPADLGRIGTVAAAGRIHRITTRGLAVRHAAAEASAHEISKEHRRAAAVHAGGTVAIAHRSAVAAGELRPTGAMTRAGKDVVEAILVRATRSAARARLRRDTVARDGFGLPKRRGRAIGETDARRAACRERPGPVGRHARRIESRAVRFSPSVTRMRNPPCGVFRSNGTSRTTSLNDRWSAHVIDSMRAKPFGAEPLRNL